MRSGDKDAKNKRKPSENKISAIQRLAEMGNEA